MSDDKLIGLLDEERHLLRKQRKVMITDEICSGEAKNAIEDFNILLGEGTDPITLLISSPGGDVLYGMAIVQCIREAQRKGVEVIGEVYGLACSMGFIILQTCDVRRMGDMCVLMAHGFTTIVQGDSKDIDAERGLIMWYRENIAAAHANRCTVQDSIYSDPATWMEIMTSSTPVYFNAQDALELGLVDEVI